MKLKFSTPSKISRCFLVMLALCGLLTSANGQTPGVSAQSGAQLRNGPFADPGFFPIAVWLQGSHNAAAYKAAGINLYVALSGSVTESSLAELQKAGVSLISEQTDSTLKNKANPVIVGWMQGDEPDDAQSLGKDKGYGPPISPRKIMDDYQKMHAADPSRPVFLNLSMGVAWDGWFGRGVRTNHPEDYPEYAKGCDIVSFDIYPVTETAPALAGKLEFVSQGVERLIKWTHGSKPVWNCIECTHIGNPKVKPTPGQVRSEVWMALIHGSHGIVYFSHEFKPAFKEAGLLADPEMLAGVTALNQQIHDLAPVLNSPTVADAATVKSSAPDSPIACMVKRDKGAVYVFAANMRNTPAHGLVELRGPNPTGTAEVLGESRKISVENGKFGDEFKPYDVHIYQIKAAQ